MFAVRLSNLKILAALLLAGLAVAGCGSSDSGSTDNADGAGSDPGNLPGTTPNTAPRIIITAPSTNSTVVAGTAVTMTAASVDDEDGSLDSSIRWQSSLEGTLGTGNRITDVLSVGNHTITARVTDSGGLIASNSITVNVTPLDPGPSLTAPVVNISAPSGTSVSEGESIALTGSASDAEDGNITSALRWNSSLDGVLPVSGGTFSQVLSVGTHTITATAKDSSNLEGSDTIKVTIIANDVVLTAFYVDREHPDASDSNPGTESRPWKTIVHAAETLTAGEMVYIKAGVYDDGNVDVEHSGLRGQEIIFSAYPGDERRAVVYGGTFNIKGRSHIKVIGLKIEKSGHRGFYIQGNSDPYGPPVENITLSGNHTYDTYSSGISVWGVPYSKDPGNFINIVDLVIENNLIEKANNGGYNECITLANGIVNADVRNNEVTTGGNPINGGEGIDFKDGVRDSKIRNNYIHGLNRRGIYVDGGETAGAVTSNVHIYNNLILNDPSSAIMIASEGVGNVDGVYIYNNVILGAEQNGISVYNHPEGRGISDVQNIYIYNNTVVDGGRGGSGWGNIGINHPEATNIVIRNNITRDGNGFDIKSRDNNTTISNNLCREDFCELNSNPMFVNPTFDPATADYRLQAGSPAIDQGVVMEGLSFDHDGTERPQGAATDLGAYEYKP